MVEFPKNENYQGEDRKAYRRVSPKVVLYLNKAK